MATYAGGTRVQSGYYLDARRFAFVSVPEGGGALPADPGARWRRVPLLAVVAAAPAMGGLLVVALPFIGIGVTAYALARKLGAGARSGAREMAATLAPAAAPGEAHLGGGSAGEVAPRPPSALGERGDAAAEALAKEIDAKRGG
jgi:hypothetical protein